MVVSLNWSALNLFSSIVGVHKIQRVPSTEKNGRRHSSEVTVVAVQDSKLEIVIKDSDLQYETYKGSGPGGQKRNKTESCVRLIHKPTGIVAIAEDSVSQYQNRQKARARITQRVAEYYADQAKSASDKAKASTFGGTAEWTWVGWRDKVTAPNGAKAPMKQVLKKGIPKKLLK